jgi:cobalt-zinc-cadmium resistance protein CzcA
MSGILLAGFGGLLSLFVTRQPISISAIVGFVSTIGISILNISFLLEQYKIVSREETVDRTQAIKLALARKFRPLLASSITASLGLLPTALSSVLAHKSKNRLLLL